MGEKCFKDHQIRSLPSRITRSKETIKTREDFAWTRKQRKKIWSQIHFMVWARSRRAGKKTYNFLQGLTRRGGKGNWFRGRTFFPLTIRTQNARWYGRSSKSMISPLTPIRLKTAKTHPKIMQNAWADADIFHSNCGWGDGIRKM